MFCLNTASIAFSLPKEYKSTRRAVTEKEKEDALLSALQEQTDASFTVVLPPSTVYRRFFLVITIIISSNRIYFYFCNLNEKLNLIDLICIILLCRLFLQHGKLSIVFVISKKLFFVSVRKHGTLHLYSMAREGGSQPGGRHLPSTISWRNLMS